MKMIAILAVALALAGCGGETSGVAVETQFKPVYVPTPVSCPSADVYRSLKADRPTPLARQAMPATAEERTAKTSAQLGRYEAKGGWGDRVEAALDRCQIREGLTTVTK